MFTKEYRMILDKIVDLKISPFKYPLKEYCSDIVDKPRCIYCDSISDGLEIGMSPKFDNTWTFGWHLCFHSCFECEINKEHAIQDWFDTNQRFK